MLGDIERDALLGREEGEGELSGPEDQFNKVKRLEAFKDR